MQLEPPQFDLGRQHSREILEIVMKAERGCDDVNKSGFFLDLKIAEQPRLCQYAFTTLQLDLSPIIRRLKNRFAIRRRLEFDQYETAVTTECEQIDLVGRRAELIVDRREDQVCVQPSDVTF